MAVSKPIATGLAFPSLADKYPDLAFRFWSRDESAVAGGYEWIASRASFTSAATSLTEISQQAAFQVILTPEQVNIYLAGEFKSAPTELSWWWQDGQVWRRIPRVIRGIMTSDTLTDGVVLAGTAISNPDTPGRSQYNWTPESHRERYPDDEAFNNARRFASVPRPV